jgi:hypothetical protein
MDRRFAALTALMWVAAALGTGCDKLPTDENLAKVAVRERLFDPESAQFSEVFTGTPGSGAICGLVNAKNRMGGYVGRRPFFYSKSSGNVVLVREPPDDGDFIAYYHSIGGPNSLEKRLELSQRCNAATEWEMACGRKLHEPQHRLCAMMMMNEPNAIHAFLLELRKLARVD